MLQIGKNLDRVTCWHDRPPKSDLVTTKAGHSSWSHSEGCDYLVREAEREDCRRKETADIGLVTLAAGKRKISS